MPPSNDPFFGGNSCPGLDADSATAGRQPDVCDTRETGWRLGPDSRLDPINIGSPNPNACAGAPYRDRGFYQRNCAISVFYETPGDPGPDCSVLNFGAHYRPDEDCDGVDDTLEDETCNLATGFCNNKSTIACSSDAQCGATGDLCPFFTETGILRDTNGDGIGDDCQCGDANEDGSMV